MATVKKHRLSDKHSAEMVVDITTSNTDSSGAAYRFILKRRHIEVEQITPTPNKEKAHSKGRNTDWFSTLTQQEKGQVFAIILDEYRERSLGDNGFKGASIGVADEKKIHGQSRLFIGTNTTRWASPYFKHCAEQNMVNAATDTLMYERSLLKESERKELPRAPKFKAVYVLQATDDGKVPMSCPCGKCIDMLSNGVMKKDGQIYTLPRLTDKVRKALDSNTDTIIVNTTAKTLNEIKAPVSEAKYEIWQTPIEFLNRNREVKLDGVVSSYQRDALRHHLFEDVIALAKNPQLHAQCNIAAMVGHMTLPSRREADKSYAHSALTFLTSFANSVAQSVKLVAQKIRGLTHEVVEPANKAAENEVMHRHSIAALDCAMKNDILDSAACHAFLRGRIIETLADRLRCDPDVNLAAMVADKDTGKKAFSEWLTAKDANGQPNITSIRCVVIQLDDGTFRYAVQADTKFDKAMPNAEVVALEQATESLGQQGVRRVWCEEFNPEAIKHGQLVTSPKEGIERLMKKASKQGIEWRYMPFVSDDFTSAKLNSMMVEKEDADLYPSKFKGTSTNNLAASQRHASFAELVQQAQKMPALASIG